MEDLQAIFAGPASTRESISSIFEKINAEAMQEICGGDIKSSVVAILGPGILQGYTNVLDAAAPPSTDAFAQAPPAGGAETGGFNPAMFGD
jgi:hypothetical protein